jgi:hypothetical protein
MQIAISTKREYAFLWKLLTREEPAIAQRLVAHLTPIQPLESDLTKLPDYFITFCLIQNIAPKEYIGAVYNSYKTDQRRLFIAAMVKIYDSRTRLLLKTLSDTLQLQPPGTFRFIQEVEFRYKNCEDFREKVDQIVNQLREGYHGTE